jgi:hypothetical protein
LAHHQITRIAGWHQHLVHETAPGDANFRDTVDDIF